jgi:cysteine dioxygenase
LVKALSDAIICDLAGSGGVVPPAHGSLAEQLRRGAGAAAEAAPVCPNAWLLDLFLLINRAFDEERRRGYTINAYQPPESTARLDAAVRKAVQEYVVNGHQDWRQLACFNAEHYVRHLVEENENFEMILICWGKGQRSRVHNHANSVSYSGLPRFRCTPASTADQLPAWGNLP